MCPDLKHSQKSKPDFPTEITLKYKNEECKYLQWESMEGPENHEQLNGYLQNNAVCNSCLHVCDVIIHGIIISCRIIRTIFRFGQKPQAKITWLSLQTISVHKLQCGAQIRSHSHPLICV